MSALGAKTLNYLSEFIRLGIDRYNFWGYMKYFSNALFIFTTNLRVSKHSDYNSLRSIL